MATTPVSVRGGRRWRTRRTRRRTIAQHQGQARKILSRASALFVRRPWERLTLDLYPSTQDGVDQEEAIEREGQTSERARVRRQREEEYARALEGARARQVAAEEGRRGTIAAPCDLGPRGEAKGKGERYAGVVERARRRQEEEREEKLRAEVAEAEARAEAEALEAANKKEEERRRAKERDERLRAERARAAAEALEAANKKERQRRSQMEERERNFRAEKARAELEALAAAAKEEEERLRKLEEREERRRAEEKAEKARAEAEAASAAAAEKERRERFFAIKEAEELEKKRSAAAIAAEAETGGTVVARQTSRSLGAQRPSLPVLRVEEEAGGTGEVRQESHSSPAELSAAKEEKETEEVAAQSHASTNPSLPDLGGRGGINQGVPRKAKKKAELAVTMSSSLMGASGVGRASEGRRTSTSGDTVIDDKVEEIAPGIAEDLRSVPQGGRRGSVTPPEVPPDVGRVSRGDPTPPECPSPADIAEDLRSVPQGGRRGSVTPPEVPSDVGRVSRGDPTPPECPSPADIAEDLRCVPQGGRRGSDTPPLAPENSSGPSLWQAITTRLAVDKKVEVSAYRPAPKPAAETVIVRFSVVFVTREGQNVVLLGDHDELGNWDERKAVKMTWTEGHLWTAEVELPCRGIYFYKYAIKEGGRLGWQHGSNRLLTIPDPADKGAGPLIEAHDSWDGDPVTSSVMQTTVDGKSSWPTSAELRLQTFLDNTNKNLEQLKRDLLELADGIRKEEGTRK
ncbi:carbohydrate-binding protein [Chloropicon primus]|nr:carbohydrate-binding protein [Chloropicon primus]